MVTWTWPVEVGCVYVDLGVWVGGWAAGVECLVPASFALLALSL